MQHRGRIAAGAGAAVIAGAAVLFLTLAEEGGPGGPVAAPGHAEGAALYAQHCASCHGASLEGEPNWRERKADGRLPAPPHDATGHTWHHPDQQLFLITKHGIAAFAPPGYESDMPGFAEIMTDDEIGAVLDHIKSTWPEEIRRIQDEITERAKGG